MTKEIVNSNKTKESTIVTKASPKWMKHKRKHLACSSHTHANFRKTFQHLLVTSATRAKHRLHDGHGLRRILRIRRLLAPRRVSRVRRSRSIRLLQSTVRSSPRVSEVPISRPRGGSRVLIVWSAAEVGIHVETGTRSSVFRILKLHF